MKKDMDKIQFEHRSELDEVEAALREYEEKHGDETPESVRTLANLLENMWYSW